MAIFGWLDLSDEHRKKVMMVMDMFKEQGVIDELGLGTIRDSLSDLLFPGTSTIQTRAKYFLIIPQIFNDIERKNKYYGKEFIQELEKEERNALLQLDNNEPKGRSMGIIGRTLHSKNPKRKPSSIYWNGLRTYKILNFQGSIADYASYIKHHSNQLTKQKFQKLADSGNVKGDDKDVSFLYNSHLWSQIPLNPINKMSINLTYEEAKFLKDKIIIGCPKSLFAYTLAYLSIQASKYRSVHDYLNEPQLPSEFKIIIQLSCDIDRIMKGALIRYNYLIQRNREKGNVTQTKEVWESYLINMREFDWANWNMKYLWDLCPKTKYGTKLFVESWIELIKQAQYNEAIGDKLIVDREFRLKGPKRSRLYDKTIAQKQVNWTGISVDEQNNAYYLSFRWGIVKTFVNDILNGLNTNDASTE